MITAELKNKIKNIWDIFYAAGTSDAISVVDQVTNLLFIKILDDNEIKQIKIENHIRDAGYTVTPKRIFDAEHQCCRWSIFHNYAPSAMFDNMSAKVFPFIKNELAEGKGKDSAFAKYMATAMFTIPTPQVLQKVVSCIDGLDLDDKDIMGDFYEELYANVAANGSNGSFRTPRHIIKMIVDFVKPTITDVICDPAMGSAGFITASAQYIRDNYDKELKNKANYSHFNNEMFYGFDTNATMLRVGAMNMMLHGVENPTIKYMDSISGDNDIRDKFSLIVANPPFSGNLFKDSIAPDLTAIANTTKTELLFVALFIKMLKVGGRCASVVPDGVLFGSSNAHMSLRKEIVDNQKLEAIISLPSGAFKPYAGVKTSIIIFTKTNYSATDKVWFYDMKNIGFSLDDKCQPIDTNDIPDAQARYANLEAEESRTRKDQSFFVTVDEIRNNNYDLTVNKYKEVEKEVKVYRPVSEIMEDIRKTQEELNESLKALEELLK